MNKMRVCEYAYTQNHTILLYIHFQNIKDSDQFC